MSNIAFWLVAFASTGLAFAGVYKLGWSLVASMIAGTALALILSLPVMALAPAEESSPWFQLELTLNGSVGLIFAGAGAAAAYALRSSRR